MLGGEGDKEKESSQPVQLGDFLSLLVPQRRHPAKRSPALPASRASSM